MSRRLLAKVPNSWILLACIGLIALNMRGPFLAVAPVVETMQRELGFSPVMLGLLTSIPVLCFSLFAPLASLTARKFGAEFAITLVILGVLAGVIVRSSGGPVLVVLGTVIIGVAITIGNISVPIIIRRDFSPLRQGTAMGVYTAALNIGSFAISMVTAPLAELAGWRVSLAFGGLFAVAAIVFWTSAVGHRRAFVPTAQDLPAGQREPSTRSSGWITAGLTVGFAGQAFSYYAVAAWLPSYLNDELDMSASAAGAGSSIFQILAIVGSFGVPFATKYFSTTTTAVTLGLLWAAVPLGLLVAPGLWWLWSVSGGIAQGGGMTLILIAIIKLARDQASAGRMSAVVQGVGYCFAAVAPPLIGFARHASGSWTVPLLVILASALAFLVGTTLSVRLVPKQR